jgi:hypothetical protein
MCFTWPFSACRLSAELQISARTTNQYFSTQVVAISTFTILRLGNPSKHW